MEADILALLERLAGEPEEELEMQLRVELEAAVRSGVSRLAPYLEEIFAPTFRRAPVGSWPDLALYTEIAEIVGHTFEIELVELYLRRPGLRLAEALGPTLTESGVERLLDALVGARTPAAICEMLAAIERALGDRPLPPRLEALGRACRLAE